MMAGGSDKSTVSRNDFSAHRYNITSAALTERLSNSLPIIRQHEQVGECAAVVWARTIRGEHDRGSVSLGAVVRLSA